MEANIIFYSPKFFEKWICTRTAHDPAKLGRVRFFDLRNRVSPKFRGILTGVFSEFLNRGGARAKMGTALHDLFALLKCDIFTTRKKKIM